MKQTDPQRLIAKWENEPIEWVKDTFGRFEGLGLGEAGLTNQQENAFRELGKLIRAKKKSIKRQPMTDEEREYASKIGISIMSGQGPGKDFIAALTILYFMSVFPNVKVPCTAPSAHQLKDILWSEISKIMRKARKANPESRQTVLEELFEWQSDKVFLKEKKGKEWFAVARTINTKASDDEQAETLSGFHEDFMLFVIDEATGIPEAVFKPIEGTLTGKLNIVLMIFNPTRSKCFAVNSQSSDSKRWITLRWNAEDSELVTRSHIEGMKDKYGEDSNTYRIRVLGIPPISDTDSLIPWDWIEDAVDREIIPLEWEPIIKSLDCGAGGDKSVICTRKGGKVFPLKKKSTVDSTELMGWALMDLDADEADAMIVDVIGIGWGVYGILNEKRRSKVTSVDSRGRADNPQKFINKRAECYWNLRTVFEKKGISIPNDTELIDQLGAIKYKLDSHGRVQIFKKEELKKIIGHSPDEADALANSYAYSDKIFITNYPQPDLKRYDTRPKKMPVSWMAR